MADGLLLMVDTSGCTGDAPRPRCCAVSCTGSDLLPSARRGVSLVSGVLGLHLMVALMADVDVVLGLLCGL
jgi:hypothetical protein